MTHEEMIAVIQAHKEGKPIELRQRFTEDGWHLRPADRDNLFDFVSWEYRVAKTPRTFQLLSCGEGKAFVFIGSDQLNLPAGQIVTVKEEIL